MILAVSTKSFSSKQEVFDELAQHKELAIDVETLSRNSRIIFGFAVAWSPRDAVWFSEPDIPFDILPKHPFVMHNVLFDEPVIHENYGIHIQYIADSLLMAQACGYPAALEELARFIYFDFPHKPIDFLLRNDSGKLMARKTLFDCDEQEAGKICCNHAMGSYKIWERLKGKTPPAYSLDFDLLPHIMKLHNHGIKVDTNLARERHYQLTEEILYIRNLCEGLGFNPASPKQIGMKLSMEGFSTYFRKGNMVTDEEALMPLYDKTPIVPMVLQFREKNKLCSTYLTPLIEVNRIFPHYHIVRTGRFASKPNIQNIPKDIRDMYLPDDGMWFWDGDLAQIEPTLMGFFSGDKQLLADLATGDVYLPISQRYGVQRYVAKQLFLATSYEAGWETLVETARGKGDYLSPSNAQALIDQYLRDYATLRAWGDNVRASARRDGYVLTLLGRKRTLESMLEGEEAGYDPVMKAVNTVVQGSAADIHKQGFLVAGNCGLDVNALIHDEMLISTDKKIDDTIFTPLLGVDVRWDIERKKNWLEKI